MTGETAKTIPLRTRLGIYGSGLFSDGATNVVVPLWVLYLEPSPLAFGIVIGARSFLPFLFSIHGGVLMDRLGAGGNIVQIPVNSGRYVKRVSSAPTDELRDSG